MRPSKQWRRNCGASVLSLISIVAGCSSAEPLDDSSALGDAAGDASAQSATLRSMRGSHHSRPAGSGGSPTSSGGASSATDCSVCAVAEDCCHAVSAGALCTFSQQTCSSLDPGRQASYALYCLTVLRTTISAWNINGATPPAVCKLP